MLQYLRRTIAQARRDDSAQHDAQRRRHAANDPGARADRAASDGRHVVAFPRIDLEPHRVAAPSHEDDVAALPGTRAVVKRSARRAG